MKKIFYTAFHFCSALLMSSCIGDLDQYPHEEETSSTIYTSAANYKAVLGKIYTTTTTTGQEKNGDNDLGSSSGQDYMRCFSNLQERGTDEVVSIWLSGDNVTEPTCLSWDANDLWVSDMYYRIYYNIALCNEFLRNTIDEEIVQFTDQEQTEIRIYRTETRFIRALFCYHALDLFRNIPFMTENDPLVGYLLPCYTAQQIFDYIESELNAIEDEMLNKANCPYGRASQGATYILLAKLYLNAEVCTQTSKHNECIRTYKKVIKRGYQLESDYYKLFNADNDRRTNEIIFTPPVDATNLVSQGSSTYIVCGAVSNTSEKQIPEDYGVESGWGMFRIRGEIPQLFSGNEEADQRYMLFTDGQTRDLEEIDDQSNGYFVEKWANLTDVGQTASNTADGGVNTDYPLFRLADVYLMMAEAVVRGGTEATLANVLPYINELWERAFGDNINNKSESEISELPTINKRARKLYWEGYRRTGLIRFNQFTTNSYVWQWRGDVKDGKAVESKYSIYLIPTTELTANPNLYNENY